MKNFCDDCALLKRIHHLHRRLHYSGQHKDWVEQKDMHHRTAILVDGAFFLMRYRAIKRLKTLDPVRTANDLWRMCIEHVTSQGENYELYRIFYYDCYPYNRIQQNPVTGEIIDFSKTEQYEFRIQFINEIKKKRKVALRLGVLEERGGWVIRPEATRALLSGEKSIEELTEDDVHFELHQKRVDIKIGLDIASLSLKRLVDQIILISGDSDFVPASKFARREGIDFILDPMWFSVNPHLIEHVDGLTSKIEKPSWFY